MTDAIQERLQALVKKGRLTPQAVLKDASNPKSPLHEQFEWDDGVAAAQWRLRQARELIRSVKVVLVEETRMIETVAYVRDPEAGPTEPGYVRTVDLRDDVERARMALANEASRAAAYLARVKALAAGLGLEKEVEVIEGQFNTLRERMAR